MARPKKPKCEVCGGKAYSTIKPVLCHSCYLSIRAMIRKPKAWWGKMEKQAKQTLRRVTLLRLHEKRLKQRFVRTIQSAKKEAKEYVDE